MGTPRPWRPLRRRRALAAAAGHADPAEYHATAAAYCRHVDDVAQLPDVEAWWCPSCGAWWTDRPGDVLRPAAGTRASVLCPAHAVDLDDDRPDHPRGENPT